MRWDFYGLSDIGTNRQSNQDVWSAHPDLGFFALADGMGGRKGGQIAAKAVIESLHHSIRVRRGDPTFDLEKAIRRANEQIYQMGSQTKELFGMGTTLCCLLWLESRIYYAHVGDSRIYRFRKKKLELLTQDHSLLAKWASERQPHAPFEEAMAMAIGEKNHRAPPKHIITRAIGPSNTVHPELSSCTALEKDLFLLCSDGLSDALSKSALEAILQEAQSLENAAQRMIEYAKLRGTGDNITVLMVQLR